MRNLSTVGIGLLLLALSSGCGMLRLASDSDVSPAPEAALQGLVQGWSFPDTVTVLGFRDHWGKSPASGQVLETALLSALGHRGVVVKPGAGVLQDPAPTMRFEKGSILPGTWRELTGSASPVQGLVLGGQIRSAERWVYLRLALADAATGVLLEQGTARVSQARLDQLVAARDETADLKRDVDVEFHLLAKREEAGFVEKIEITEGATLVEGDRLQIRLRSEQDCEVFAFLYASKDGDRRDLVGADQIYANRWNYGPGENSWVSLKGDEVYTLYLMIAPRIEEDRSNLWDAVQQWQRQGAIDRMEGLDLFDGALEGFLQDSVSGIDSVRVQRGPDEIELADQADKFTYSDGTVFESTAERLHGVVILRAISFWVRWK
ncbi:MAG: hypothetical protein HN712_06230 [Gemmatimonadetes bacterium]|jgi:hypothetical protein|nr:hypothetical protein [Gemmatimonadota bacterium]MBT7859890.1 hypothetical protein [Gemmatimonadota bacterium]